MIRLKVNEKVVKAFEVKKSSHGRGIFYITNRGVYLETQQKGLVLELPFEILKTYKETAKDTFRIEWEQNGSRLHYEFKVQGSAREVFDSYFFANNEFARSVSEIDALRDTQKCTM